MPVRQRDINFFDPAVVADPYPYYEEIRAAGRVVWNDIFHAWMVTGFEDCKAVLSEPSRFSNAQYRDREKVWCDLFGTEVAKGQTVLTMPAAANRDPDRWADPLRFDIRREQKPHLGFGHGHHLCIGAPLARLETRIAVERLLRLAPEYSLRDVDYGKGWFVRGPERGLLQVAVPASA